MGWDVAIHRKEGVLGERCHTVVRYQRSHKPDMGEVLFDHPDVYDYEKSSCLLEGETFIPDIAFVPNWTRLFQRCVTFTSSPPVDFPEDSISVYNELAAGIRDVFMNGVDNFEMVIG